MPVPADLSVSIFTCERTLQESDGIITAVRIVDVFFVSRLPTVPIENQVVQMYVIGIVKSKNLALGKHTIRIDLLRPDGERKLGPQTDVIIAEPKFPAPTGFNLNIQAGVAAKQNGTHLWILLMDDEEIARVPFTLLEKPAEAAQP